MLGFAIKADAKGAFSNFGITIWKPPFNFVGLKLEKLIKSFKNKATVQEETKKGGKFVVKGSQKPSNIAKQSTKFTKK